MKASGSAGLPKGVVYRHRHFVAQIDLLRAAFGIEPGGVDLPTFPPFALFDPALGLTSVIPDMDPTRPARADPRKLLDGMQRFGVDRLFGSPALMDVLARHAQPLPGLRAVSSAGTCVGRPVPPNVVRIIGITDEALPEWSGQLVLGAHAIGEITVAGPSATDEYFRRPDATALAKIRERLDDGGERIVHRMGDLGWFDETGRLWFCGRKSQRVRTAEGTLFTEQVEPVFNTHPQVRRSALVGVGAPGAQRAVLCVELREGVDRAAGERVLAELAHQALGLVHTARIAHFLRHPRFPVDIRHNAKIGREQLSRWATDVLRRKQ